MRTSAFRPLVLLACLVAGPCLAAEEADAPKYYKERDRGWHFYEDPPPPPKPKPRPKPLPGGGQGSSAPAPAPLSAAWLRANLDTFRDRALDAPTRENVELYAYLQRYMMDKAEVFASMMSTVSTLNPALDESSQSPLSAYQYAAAQDVMSAARKAALQKISRTVGMWYFFRSDCPYCAKQDPVLERISADTGLAILPISMDGKPLMSGAFPDYVNDAGHGARLGVIATPTLVLAHPTSGETMKIAEGLKTRSEIEDRLLLTARDYGWITSAEHDEAMRGMPRRFLTDGLSPEDMAEIDASPDALLGLLREASLQGGATPLDAPAGDAQ